MYEQLIKTNRLFKDFTEQQYQYLIQHTSVMRLSANTVIRDNDEKPARSFLVLLEGEWHMQRKIAGVDEPLVYHTDEPGSWHGGITIIDIIGIPSVKTVKDCVLLEIPDIVMFHMLRHGYPVLPHIVSGAKWGFTKMEALIEGDDK